MGISLFKVIRLRGLGSEFLTAVSFGVVGNARVPSCPSDTQNRKNRAFGELPPLASGKTCKTVTLGSLGALAGLYAFCVDDAVAVFVD